MYSDSSKKIIRGEIAQSFKGIDFQSFDRKPVNYHKEIVEDAEPVTESARSSKPSSHSIQEAVSHETGRLRKEMSAKLKIKLQEAELTARDSASHEFQKAIDLLSNYAKLLSSEKEELTARYENEVFDLAFEIASKILGHEIKERPESIAKIARTALEQVIDCQKIAVRVNPNDLSYLQNLRADLAGQLSQDARIELISDSSVESGGCVVDTEKGSLDARIDSQLETMKSNLSTRSGE